MPLYHVWFATKRRKWLLQGDVLNAMRDLLQTIAQDKEINLLESEAIVDHVHLLLEAEDQPALSKAVNLLKGISSRRIFERFPELKMDAGVNSFWQHRYASKEVAPVASGQVRQYIQTQWNRLEKYAH